MKEGQRLWSREELILAISLYCKLPFGRLHRLNPAVIELAGLIGRTPNSVAFKLVNLASLDPILKERGIKGASNASKLDEAIWNEFFNESERLTFESEKLLAQLKHTTVEALYQIPEEELPKEGKVREQVVKIRVNQAFFRSTVLTAYNNTCCVTGIKQPQLLVAGHIRPWSMDKKNRLNPRNGLAMNGLHDKAFEAGFMTITPDYRIRISPVLLKQKEESIDIYFRKYDGQPIIIPTRFLPDVAFLKYHNDHCFKQ